MKSIQAKVQFTFFFCLNHVSENEKIKKVEITGEFTQWHPVVMMSLTDNDRAELNQQIDALLLQPTLQLENIDDWQPTHFFKKVVDPKALRFGFVVNDNHFETSPYYMRDRIPAVDGPKRQFKNLSSKDLLLDVNYIDLNTAPISLYVKLERSPRRTRKDRRVLNKKYDSNRMSRLSVASSEYD